MSNTNKKKRIPPLIETSVEKRFDIAYTCPTLDSLKVVLTRFSEGILAFVKEVLSQPGNRRLCKINIDPYDCYDSEACRVVVTFTRDMTQQEIVEKDIAEDLNRKKKRVTLDAIIKEFGSVEKLIQYTNSPSPKYG